MTTYLDEVAIPIYPTRVLLAAGEPARTAWLQEAGREGVFEWDDSNLSTEVAADAQQGIYVPVTGLDGSDGAWVRTGHGNVIRPRWFGAAGDGATDDATPLLACLNAATGCTVDGEGLTYRLDALIQPATENLTFRNATIDISNVASAAGIKFSGSLGTTTNLSGAIAVGDSVLTVADTSGFTADDHAWLESAEIYATSVSAILAIFVKIKSVDSATQVTLYDDVPYAFAYASPGDITLAPATLKGDITFENVNFSGASAGTQTALAFDKCSDVTVRDTSMKYVDYTALLFSQCVGALADGVRARHARAVGLAYGVVVANGCLGVRIANGFGRELRHYVSVGDNGGVNRYVSVINNNIVSSTDAGIDTHPSCDHFSVVGNVIEGAAIQPTGDGIVCQCPNFVCADNTIIGATRHAILYQPATNHGKPMATITGNLVSRGGDGTGTDVAINIDNTGTVDIEALVVANNIVDGVFSYGIYLLTTTADIRSISVTGNTIRGAVTYGIAARANATFEVDKVVISNNNIEGSGSAGIYVFGISSGQIKALSCIGNIVDGFSFGVRVTRCVGAIIAKNTILNFSDPFEIDTASTGVEIDDMTYGNPVTVTNSTLVLEEDDTHIICNRAATITLTFRTASVFVGREITVKTIQAQAVVSASSNVVPIDSATAGTAILPATDGAWAQLKSDGTNWVIMAQG
jgi:hypothetical protein